jgi:hypothetical protein
MVGLGQAVAARVYALRVRYWAIIDAIAAATDAAELAAIDVAADWPA